MTEVGNNSYDRLPYLSQPFAQTHPERLAAIATLFGMTPPAVRTCRVLELGCAAGGNLIPMAAHLPEASFVGLDLSARQIGDGKAFIQGANLTNIELKQMDIAQVDASMGQFDYIIAHGVFSWVPRQIQDKILAICSENLVRDGVAYVSYNTYPGWRMRGMMRDMMLYHSRMFADSTVQVQQARALLDFLAANVPTENNPYGILLKQEVEMLRTQGDFYLAHDHLEEVNEPVYFHEFAERANAHGLQYLGEAEFHTMLASNFAPQVVDTLKRIAPDIVRMEQYMDFLRNRVFRQTLLVQRDIRINRNLNWASMERLAFASQAMPVNAQPDLTSNAREQFRTPVGLALETPDPIVKSAMTILAENWPRALSFSDLLRAAESRLESLHAAPSLPSDPRSLTQILGTELMKCAGSFVVELHTHLPPFATEVGERPRATALSRRQAQMAIMVTNLRHEPVKLDEFTRQLMLILTGEHDRTALLNHLEQLVSKRVLAVQKEGKVVENTAEIRDLLRGALDQNLPLLAKAALLEQ